VRRNLRRWGRLCGEQNAEAASRGAAERGVPPGRPHGAAMSSDFESYEQDFAVLTADITGRIGRVPKLLGGERRGGSGGAGSCRLHGASRRRGGPGAGGAVSERP